MFLFEQNNLKSHDDYVNSISFNIQHGTGNEAALALARQSLYQKFDPLIGGRPSIMPKTIIDEQDEDGEDAEEESNNNDLIAMNSPSRRASRPATHQPTVRENFSTQKLNYSFHYEQCTVFLLK